MYLKLLNEKFTICKIHQISQVDFSDDYWFLAKTDEELSLICTTRCVPEDTVGREDGWRGFRIQGVLDFSLVGILSKISAILTNEKIGIFAVSTFNTDYILIKEENFSRAIKVLKGSGYTVEES